MHMCKEKDWFHLIISSGGILGSAYFWKVTEESRLPRFMFCLPASSTLCLYFGLYLKLWSGGGGQYNRANTIQCFLFFWHIWSFQEYHFFREIHVIAQIRTQGWYLTFVQFEEQAHSLCKWLFWFAAACPDILIIDSLSEVPGEGTPGTRVSGYLRRGTGGTGYQADGSVGLRLSPKLAGTNGRRLG